MPQLFAEALQIKTGGKLTGADARAVLMKQMELGNVKTADLLPIVSRLMNDLSAGGIEQARRSSGAEQMRAENALIGRGGLLQTFSQSGGESGFARFWRGVNSQLEHSKPLAEGFARAFENSAMNMEKLLTWTESFNNAIEGKDSQVADWLGAEKTEQLKKDWTEIKSLIDQIFNQTTPEWLPTMEDITKRLSDVLGMIAEFSNWKSATGSAVSHAYQTEGVLSAGWLAAKSGGALLAKGVGSGYQNLLETLPFAMEHPIGKAAHGWVQPVVDIDSNMFANDYWKSKNVKGTMSDADAALQSGNSLINPPQDDALMSLLQRGQTGSNPQQITYDNQIELYVTVNGGQEAEDWARNTFSRLVEESMTAFPAR